MKTVLPGEEKTPNLAKCPDPGVLRIDLTDTGNATPRDLVRDSCARAIERACPNPEMFRLSEHCCTLFACVVSRASGRLSGVRENGSGRWEG